MISLLSGVDGVYGRKENSGQLEADSESRQTYPATAKKSSESVVTGPARAAEMHHRNPLSKFSLAMRERLLSRLSRGSHLRRICRGTYQRSLINAC